MSNGSSGLYTITQYQQVSDSHHYTLTLATQHPIYDGHFPEQPILPGVCFLQITRELAQRSTGKLLRLTQLKTAKFPSPLNPNQTPIIELTITCTSSTVRHWAVQATATNSTTVFLKFQGTFVEH